jgi:uncharacterized protein YhbP (UPF0306 family)
MDENFNKITSFLDEHHVMSLATSSNERLSVCNLFYTFIKEEKIFIVASSDDTTHIKDILLNPNIAGSVVLESKNISKIQGLQFRGVFQTLKDDSLKKNYFKAFPYALAMNPKLWQIKVDFFKLTDNTLGFGKKIIWQESL